MLTIIKHELTGLVRDYIKGGRGPAKFEALAEFFQTWFLDKELSEVLRQVDDVYEHAENKVKLMISESSR